MYALMKSIALLFVVLLSFVPFDKTFQNSYNILYNICASFALPISVVNKREHFGAPNYNYRDRQHQNMIDHQR